MSFEISRFKGRLPKTCVNAFASALYSFEGALRLLQRAKGQRPGHRGGVAQLGEHLLCKQGVIGSNPFISTNPYVGGACRQLTVVCADDGLESETRAHSSAG